MPRRSGPNPGFPALLLLGLAGVGQGESPGPPMILGVDPPGARVGETRQWTFAGRNLARVRSLRVSGGGVEVVALTPVDEATVRATVRVAPETPPGYREVRLDGPDGVSNLAIVRLDTLRESAEAEPPPADPQVVEAGTVVNGRLRPLDVDTYRVRGTPGARLTIDLEARRVGTAIAPVLTILDDSGRATAQAREEPGGDRDARMAAVVPAGGSFLVRVRDNTYGGGDQARYRLRVDPAPFATASFPLGGTRGTIAAVAVSGGSLVEPRPKTIPLPETAGMTVEVGLVDGPGGPLLAPGRLAVGEGPEVVEPTDRAEGAAISVPAGATVNGRLARPGEVDRYRVAVEAGERFRARTDAARLGSWLDSVLVVRDAAGVVLAENDDGPESAPDSAVEIEVKSDGVLTVEVADRFGAGGPEYGYRLTLGEARPDFTLTVLPGKSRAAGPDAAGRAGTFNVRPGSVARLDFRITPIGRPGPVEVRVEGLPDGVTAEPISIRLPGPTRPGAAPGPPPQAVADFLQIRVGPKARPGLSEFRVVARSRPLGGVVIEREGSATIDATTARVSGGPIPRVLDRFPLRVVGEEGPGPRDREGPTGKAAGRRDGDDAPGVCGEDSGFGPMPRPRLAEK